MPKIILKTLTPLWTGGVDGTCDRLHETGLIGSLRWWYEALVRGLGGYACDPTEHSCTFDEERYRKSRADDERQRLRDAGVCDVCQLFGCTGWARKFRLKASDGEILFDGENVLIPSGRVHQSRKGPRAGGWFVFSKSRIGEIELEIIPLGSVDLAPIFTILSLISRHASLGAKGSNGYGVIQAQNIQPQLTWLDAFPGSSPRNQSLPDFRDFFFAKFQFDEPADNKSWWENIYGIRQAIKGKLDDGTLPIPLKEKKYEIEQMIERGILPLAPAIRNWLRYRVHRLHRLTPRQAHFVFGEAQAVCPKCYSPGFKHDKKRQDFNWCPSCKQSFKKGDEIPTTASKIQVSYAYRLDSRWEFRIWGWLPCTGAIKDRDKFLQKLKDELVGDALWKDVFGNTRVKPALMEWHAWPCNRIDGRAYLQELLGGAA
jgi:CRISPR type III-B/RAMP module RAMP protein Cmr1